MSNCFKFEQKQALCNEVACSDVSIGIPIKNGRQTVLDVCHIYISEDAVK